MLRDIKERLRELHEESAQQAELVRSNFEWLVSHVRKQVIEKIQRAKSGKPKEDIRNIVVPVIDEIACALAYSLQQEQYRVLPAQTRAVAAEILVMASLLNRVRAGVEQVLTDELADELGYSKETVRTAFIDASAYLRRTCYDVLRKRGVIEIKLKEPDEKRE